MKLLKQIDEMNYVIKLSTEATIDINIITRVSSGNDSLSFESVFNFFNKNKEKINKLDFDNIKSYLKANQSDLKNYVKLLNKLMKKKIFDTSKLTQDDWLEEHEDDFEYMLLKLIGMFYFLKYSDKSLDKTQPLTIDILSKAIDHLKITFDNEKFIIKQKQDINMVTNLSNNIYDSDIGHILSNNICVIVSDTSITEEDINPDGYMMDLTESWTHSISFEAYVDFYKNIDNKLLNVLIKKLITSIGVDIKNIDTVLKIHGKTESETNKILDKINTLEDYKSEVDKYEKIVNDYEHKADSVILNNFLYEEVVSGVRALYRY